MNTNVVVLIGRLTREAVLKSTASGTMVSKFSIAVNRKVKKNDDWVDEPSYFDITCFGKQAESVHPFLFKGKMIAVVGELRQDRWIQDGQNRSRIEIIADQIQLLGDKKDKPVEEYFNDIPM